MPHPVLVGSLVESSEWQRPRKRYPRRRGIPVPTILNQALLQKRPMHRHHLRVSVAARLLGDAGKGEWLAARVLQAVGDPAKMHAPRLKANQRDFEKRTEVEQSGRWPTAATALVGEWQSALLEPTTVALNGEKERGREDSREAKGLPIQNVGHSIPGASPG